MSKKEKDIVEQIFPMGFDKLEKLIENRTKLTFKETEKLNEMLREVSTKFEGFEVETKMCHYCKKQGLEKDFVKDDSFDSNYYWFCSGCLSKHKQKITSIVFHEPSKKQTMDYKKRREAEAEEGNYNGDWQHFKFDIELEGNTKVSQSNDIVQLRIVSAEGVTLPSGKVCPKTTFGEIKFECVDGKIRMRASGGEITLTRFSDVIDESSGWFNLVMRK